MASQLKLCASQHHELVNNSLRRRRKIMNGKNFLRTIGGFVLAASLLFGVAIMSSTAVQAQRGGGGHGGGGMGGGGFHGGGGGSHFSSGSHFSGGSHGGGRHGDHDRFRGGHTRVFIGPGFGFGYPYDDYYPYGYGYDGGYVFSSSQAADSQGYADGLKTGANDARRHKSDDPQRSHYFKEAGYSNFPEDYLAGFERGYSEGFGQGLGR
jgi:hypothetical protein